jgi:hypothetical protein
VTFNSRRYRKWLSIFGLCAAIFVIVYLSLPTATKHRIVGLERAAVSVAVKAEQAAFAGAAMSGASNGADHAQPGSSSVGASSVMTDAPGTFSFGVAGDLGGTGAAATTFEALAKAKPDFFLAIGDLSYNDIAPEAEWCSYVKEQLGAKYPFEVLVGNHEQEPSSNSGFIDNFAKCLPDRLGEKGRYAHRYYFDYPPDAPLARFIFIDPDLPRGSKTAEYCKDGEKSNCRWLMASIDEAKSKGLWTIVSMHKVCITVATKPCEVGAELFNLLLERKVDLVLQGHEHGYQRSKQLGLNADCPALEPNVYNASCVVDDGNDGSFTRGAGLVSIITAAFGRDPYEVDPSDPEAGYMATWMDDNNESKGYMQFTVAKDKIDGHFINVTGPLTDRITIVGTAILPTPAPSITPEATAAPRKRPAETPTPPAG